MDLNKSLEFFDPSKVTKPCHVIGCGSIGGNVAELLARYGIKDIHIWDADIVMPHNLANQIFTEDDIGCYKTLSLNNRLTAINPDASIKVHNKFCTPKDRLSGFIFLCLDNIETRRAIVENNMYNLAIDAIFDFRTSLLEGQCYFADWSEMEDRNNMLSTMDFTHDEAIENTEVSACGFQLSVSPVVRMCSEAGIANFTNFINATETKHLILVRPYSFQMEAY